MKERESNLELLRIVSMIMIILYHFIYHSGIYTYSWGILHIASHIIVALIIIHVNEFILITGYFGYKSKFKVSKLLALNNSIWFYVVIYTIIGSLLLNITFTKVELLKAFLPISIKDYWFMTNYLLLYLFMPFINRIINSISRKNYQLLLLTIIIVFSVLPTLTGGESYDVSSGFALYQFVMMYLIGAYLGKYKVNYSTAKIIIVFLASCFLNCLFYKIGTIIVNSPDSLLSYIGYNQVNAFLSYCNPIIILQAISFFLLFTKLRIKSTIINKISSYTLGVYLIHDNNIFRNFYRDKIIIGSDINIIFISIIVSLLVFIICTLIESIRQDLFKDIYNLEISNYLRPKYTKYFKKIEKIVNE